MKSFEKFWFKTIYDFLRTSGFQFYGCSILLIAKPSCTIFKLTWNDLMFLTNHPETSGVTYK